MERKNFIKPLVMVIAILLVVVLAAGLIAQTVIKNKKPGAENSVPTPIEKSWGIALNDDGEVLEQGSVYAMPMSLMFASTDDSPATMASLENPTVRLTANHNFSLNNIKCDWSVKYADGSSCADVVEVVPVDDDGKQADVICKAPFSKQIKVKVSARNSNATSATCDVDYIKRINFRHVSLADSAFSDSQYLGGEIEFGIGSKMGEYRIDSFDISLGGDFADDFPDLLTFNVPLNAHEYSGCVIEPYEYSDTTYYFEGSCFNMGYADFVRDWDSYDAAHKQAIQYAWYNAARHSCIYTHEDYVAVRGNFRMIIVYSTWFGNTKLETQYMSSYGTVIGYDSDAELSPNLTLNTNVGF